jgi:hypothetical protein
MLLATPIGCAFIRRRADTAGMAKRPEPPKLFWLTYHHSDGRAAGVAVIESHGLLHARLKASLAGADRGLEFASGHQLDPEEARRWWALSGRRGVGTAPSWRIDAMQDKLPMHLSPRCGAHCRTTGQPCRNAAMANGRCRMQLGEVHMELRLPTFVLGGMTFNDFLLGTLFLALPQVPLTLGNAIIAISEENNHLFPDRPVNEGKFRYRPAS